MHGMHFGQELINFFFLYETGSHYVDQADLELPILLTLTL
jgi:hypothetical protein